MLAKELQKERDSVQSVIARERRAVESGSDEDYWSVLADDAIFMPPNLPPKSGPDLRAWLKDFVERFEVEWLTFTSVDVLVIADLAVHSYSYRWRVTPRSGGESTISVGKGMHVLRKRADGSWLIWRAIWNASPATGAQPLT